MERVKRRWWTRVVTTLAALVVVGALLSGAFQLAVLAFPGYRDDVARFVSDAAGRPVDIGGVQLGWSGLYPQLELSDITLYAKDGQSVTLSARQLTLGFGLVRLVTGDTRPSNIELHGLKLLAQVDANGRLSLRGLESEAPKGASGSWSDTLDQLASFKRLSLYDSELWLSDERLDIQGLPLRLVRAQLRIASDGLQLQALLEPPAESDASVDFNAQIQGRLSHPESWQGSWTGSVRNYTGAPWIGRRLPADLAIRIEHGEAEFEGLVDQGRFGDVALSFSADRLVARTAALQEALSEVQFEAVLKASSGGWSIELPSYQWQAASGPWPQSHAHLSVSADAGSGREYTADIGFLQLEDLSRWVAFVPALERKLPGSLKDQVHGAVRSLVLRASTRNDKLTYSLRANLEAVGLDGGAESVSLDGLTGPVSASEIGGQLRIPPSTLQLTLPQQLPQPLQLESAGGDLRWVKTADGWHLAAPDIRAALGGAAVTAQLAMDLPGDPERSPTIELDGQFHADDVTQLKPYVPIFWPESLQQWLDRSVIKGRVPRGYFKLSGALRNFSDHDQPGLMEIGFDVSDAELMFSPHWPAITHAAAKLVFTSSDMRVTEGSAHILDLPLTDVNVSIEDFRDTVVTVDAQSAADAGKFYALLSASPLAERLRGLLEETTPTGAARVALTLAVPIADVEATTASGRISFDHGALGVSAIPEPIKDLSGTLSFDAQGASAAGLKGSLYGVPLTAELAPMGNWQSQLSVRFPYRPDEQGGGLSRYVPSMLLPNLQGESQWQAQMLIGGSDPLVLALSSDLVGTGIRLPPPLGKRARDAMPVELRIDEDAQQRVRIAVLSPPRVSADLRFGAADVGLVSGLIRVGAGEPPQATQAGLRVIGALSDADIVDWLDALQRSRDVTSPGEAIADAVPGAVAEQAAATTAAETDVLLSMDIDVGQLYWHSYAVRNVSVHYEPEPSGWRAQLNGAGATGTLTWRDGGAGELVARLDQARVVPRLLAEVAASDQAQADAAAGSVPTDAAQTAEPPLDPSTLPTLDIDVTQGSLGVANLGHVQLRTRRVEHGQDIELATVSGGELKLELSGQWQRESGTSNATLGIDLETSALDEILAGLGYAPSVSAREATVEAAVAWEDSASGLEWQRARGDLSILMKAGSLQAVEPGAGRVLGLFNFYALPRRVLLNFSDVVEEGLAFDRLGGHFAIGDGVASTQDLDIQGPSLKMELRGDIGLVARNYDQRVTVYPDVSSGLTLGAFLLGGPALGALALLAQEVLDKPLDQVTQFSYHVTGSWDDPQVERLSGGS